MNNKEMPPLMIVYLVGPLGMQTRDAGATTINSII